MITQQNPPDGMTALAMDVKVGICKTVPQVFTYPASKRFSPNKKPTDVCRMSFEV